MAIEVKVTDLEFSYKSQWFAFKFIPLYHQDLLMNVIYIWHDGRYMFNGLLREIPVPDLDVKVTDLEFSYRSQTFCSKVYIAILSRPLD